MFVFIFSFCDDFSVITTVVLCLFNLVNLASLLNITKEEIVSSSLKKIELDTKRMLGEY